MRRKFKFLMYLRPLFSPKKRRQTYDYLYEYFLKQPKLTKRHLHVFDFFIYILLKH